MRTTELAFVASVMLGCIFKFMHWPGASILIVLGGCLLALFYFPFGYRTLPAPKPTDQILWMTLLCGIALCITLSGIVAFMLRWPHNAELLRAGAIGSVLCLPVGIVLRYKRPQLDIYLDGLLIRCFALGGLAIMLFEFFVGRPR